MLKQENVGCLKQANRVVKKEKSQIDMSLVELLSCFSTTKKRLSGFM